MHKSFSTLSPLIVLICLSTFVSKAQAVNWTKLNENKQSVLLLDKESVIEQNNLKKAWLKIKYKTIQKNYENPEIEFDLSKVLWYFNCAEQKSATSQVAQYLSNEMVFSAGIDVKKAEFIDPVPETDVDIAMRFTCAYDRKAEEEKIAKAIAEKKAAAEAKKKAEEEEKAAAKLAAEQAEKEAEAEEAARIAEEEKAAKEAIDKEGTDSKKKKKSKKTTEWSYQNETSPEHWGELKPEYSTCATGHNQSPINIDKTVKAKLEKIRNIQKFPGKEILNDGHTVQINFGEGNMLLLDEEPYQMKQVHFHSPSEHTIHGQAFPLEAEFVHANAKGDFTVMSVMFKEGAENKALAKLWEQMPKRKSKAIALQSPVTPKDLMPTNPSYYRFSGSLTSPPCTEGVKWIILKTPLTASKTQIDAFKSAIKHDNNRPVQPLNGRVVLE